MTHPFDPGYGNEPFQTLCAQPFPLIIQEPYETHGSGVCTQHFTQPVPSLEATFAISNTRMSCGKRTSGVLEATLSPHRWQAVS